MPKLRSRKYVGEHMLLRVQRKSMCSPAYFLERNWLTNESCFGLIFLGTLELSFCIPQIIGTYDADVVMWESVMNDHGTGKDHAQENHFRNSISLKRII